MNNEIIIDVDKETRYKVALDIMDKELESLKKMRQETLANYDAVIQRIIDKRKEVSIEFFEMYGTKQERE